jgi:hypothetical protein
MDDPTRNGDAESPIVLSSGDEDEDKDEEDVDNNHEEEDDDDEDELESNVDQEEEEEEPEPEHEVLNIEDAAPEPPAIVIDETMVEPEEPSPEPAEIEEPVEAPASDTLQVPAEEEEEEEEVEEVEEEEEEEDEVREPSPHEPTSPPKEPTSSPKEPTPPPKEPTPPPKEPTPPPAPQHLWRHTHGRRRDPTPEPGRAPAPAPPPKRVASKSPQKEEEQAHDDADDKDEPQAEASSSQSQADLPETSETPQEAQPATRHRRTRSSQAFEPLGITTRSHCSPHRVELRDGSLSVSVLVPGCRVPSLDALNKESSRDLGLAPKDLATEEALQRSFHLTPTLIQKASRLFGLSTFRDDELFVLDGATPGALEAAPTRERRTSATPASPIVSTAATRAPSSQPRRRTPRASLARTPVPETTGWPLVPASARQKRGRSSAASVVAHVEDVATPPPQKRTAKETPKPETPGRYALRSRVESPEVAKTAKVSEVEDETEEREELPEESTSVEIEAEVEPEPEAEAEVSTTEAAEAEAVPEDTSEPITVDPPATPATRRRSKRKLEAELEPEDADREPEAATAGPTTRAGKRRAIEEEAAAEGEQPARRGWRSWAGGLFRRQ